MKKTKQILSVFLSVCMIISCMAGISVTASATGYGAYIAFRDRVSSIKQGDEITGTWDVNGGLEDDGMMLFADVVTIKPAGGGADIATRDVEWTADADYTITAWEQKSYSNGNLGPYESEYGGYADVNIFEYIFTVQSAAPAHTHSFTYSATGATITATCTAGCDITTAPTLTLTAPTLTVEGGEGSASATLSKSTTWTTDNGLAADPTISYYSTTTANATTGGTSLGTTAPTTAGNYYAQISIANTTGDPAVAAVAYTIAAGSTTVATPSISGTTPFTDSTEVTISCTTEGASIYYTTDGSNPTAESTAYSEAFTLTATKTVKAIAIKGTTSSEVASKAFTKESGTPAVKITPTGAGTVDLAWDSNHTNDLIFKAAANSGYEFDHWSYYSLSNSEWKEETSTSNPFTVYNYKGYEQDFKDFTAHFKATTVAVTGVTLDKTTASIEVGKTVTLTATVKPSDATDKTVTWTSSDEGVATVANGVVKAVGAGKATITAKAGGKSATCEVTVTAASGGGNSGGNSGGGYTPSYTPSYTHSTTPTTTGSFEDKTEENTNYSGAEINMKSDELEKAILTDDDKKVIANGGKVSVELEVKESTPTAEEKTAIDTAVEKFEQTTGENVTVAMYFDANLFKTSNGTKTQLHELNGKIAVSFKLPAQFKNTDSSVTRTYAVARIHDGKTEILVCEYDPATDLLTFYTDRFSAYALIFEDAPAATDTAVEETDDDDDADTDDDDDDAEDTDDDIDDDAEESDSTISDDDSDDDDYDDHSVDNDVDETNPGTGVSAGLGLLAVCAVTAGAAVALKKRNK